MNPSLNYIVHIILLYIFVIFINVVLQCTSIHDNISERISITKSSNDDRNYRYLILKNKLRVLIVSDPAAKKVGAALSVNVGYSSDPPDVPGIAHFCEHMLFLGTKKYPEESGFDSFLSQHNGRSNAYTTLEFTTYYFDVNADFLVPALDRFAQFFISPEFNQNATNRELNAIDQEYQKNSLDDSRRISHIDRVSAKPGHPYGTFGTGNLNTLKTIPIKKGINIREKLLEFYNKYYSANIMTVAIIGKQALDDLEKISVSVFKNVLNKDIKLPSFENNLPYGKNQLQSILKIPTLKDMNRLEMKFEIFELKKDYKDKALQYILRLLGHEGKGSLLALLKKKGWAYSLLAGNHGGLKGFEFIFIRMELTKDGMDHIDDIISTVFQYINMLRKEGPKRWIFDEMKTIANTRFRFLEKLKSLRYVQQLVDNMHSYSPVDVLYGPYRYDNFNTKLIVRVLGKLIPENLRYLVASKSLQNQTNNRYDPIYGMGYLSEKISSKKIEKWKNIGENKDLVLPNKNPFIPDDLRIVVPKKHKGSKTIPGLIKDTKLSRVWYKADDTFFVPRASIRTAVYSPFSSLTPSHYNHLDLLSRLVRSSLAEYIYDAKLAGIKYDLYAHSKGIYIKIDGYSSKLGVLLDEIMSHIVSLKINNELFQLQKSILQHELENRALEAPYRQTKRLLKYIIREKRWDSMDRLRSIDELTIDSFHQYIGIFFRDIYIESLFVGNILKKDALEIITSVENSLVKTFRSKPMLPIQHSLSREFIIPAGGNYLYEKRNLYHAYSAVQIYLQIGLRTLRNTVLCQILTHILHTPMYVQLRTQQQLGYIVFSGISTSRSVFGLRIQVQSDKSPELVINRIETFLRGFWKVLKKMSEKKFRKIVALSIASKQEVPKTLSHEGSSYAYEIGRKTYDFRRKLREIKVLRKLEKKNVLNFYKKYIDPVSSERKRLVIVLLGKKHNSIVNKENAKQWKVINDLYSFKASLPLYQNLMPVNGIPLIKT